MTNKYWILARSLVLAVAIAYFGGYLIELGVQFFPRYEKYVDNVVAFITVVPLIYLVFVPVFTAFKVEEPNVQADESTPD